MELNTNAHKEILDPINCSNSIRIQFHQISIGVKKILEYQTTKNIQFDILFKTRFDVKYPDNFYPYIPDSHDIINLITFNNNNKELAVKSMNNNNISTMDELIEFNKSNKITLPNCLIQDLTHWDISFGGGYNYNYISLELIKNGNLDIVYSFSQFFEFGKLSAFSIFENLFDNFWIIEPQTEYLLYHYYSPEVQIQNFCIANNIPILFYQNSSNRVLYIR
jgi:hypothetical protein